MPKGENLTLDGTILDMLNTQLPTHTRHTRMHTYASTFYKKIKEYDHRRKNDDAAYAGIYTQAAEET